MPHIIRVRRPAQFALVARLAREIWEAHFIPLIGRAQVDYMLERFQSVPALTRQVKEGYRYYLVSEEDAPAGYFALAPQTEPASIQLSKIYVLGSRRGRGIGGAVIRRLERLCRRAGIRSLWLTVNRHNRDSISFYEHAGFERAGALVQDIGGGFVMDDFKMVKRIHSQAPPAPLNPCNCGQSCGR
jgi:GNAT superfamily N-acetyltransferase